MAANEIFYGLDLEILLVLLLVALVLSLVVFVCYAWIYRDPAAKFIALLSLAWGAFLVLVILTSDRGPDPGDALLVIAVLSFLLLPGGYLFFGMGRWAQTRRFVGVLSAGVSVLTVVPVLAGLPSILFLGGGAYMGQPLEPMLDGAGVRPIMATVIVEKEVEKVVEEAGATPGDEQAAGEAPRLRQYFPETLYWAPEVLTDEEGYVSLEIPMADSITTWRLTALASSQDSQLGYATHGIRVFQDFFVDVDLPVSLTQGDEISIPVGVFNYLPNPQQVRLVVEQEPWFELLGSGEHTLTIGPNDIDVVYFPIRVKAFGRQGFQITAWGEQMSDAIRRQVRVVPDGKEIRLTESDWLREPQEITLDIPAEAVPDTPYVEVKIYPGVMAQVIEGLEKILRLPHG
jgi:hypothetical protein